MIQLREEDCHLDSQLPPVGLSRDVQEDPPPPLRVVQPAQAWYRLLALLVNVHLAYCEEI